MWIQKDSDYKNDNLPWFILCIIKKVFYRTILSNDIFIQYVWIGERNLK